MTNGRKASGVKRPRAPKRLTRASLSRGVQELSEVDEDLAHVARAYGVPPLWERAEGFPTLVLTILEQQVSLASALAAFERLRAAASSVTPESFLTFDDAQLRAFGFSRQKALYCRLLARAIIDKELDLQKLSSLSDDAARAELTRLKGVGAWTAEIYLLRALLRPDAWPAGDLALQLAAQTVKRLPARPTAAELDALAEPWRPWRAVAARLLWLQYLHGRRDAVRL
ncbi:MAG: DNA-3-methyladenine glycosylase 2 family protein [Acidobacteria bacterium]|nr:DNA-3-methyladenine glycosylase 2 family protein [Acidobacteriota bacterium]